MPVSGKIRLMIYRWSLLGLPTLRRTAQRGWISRQLPQSNRCLRDRLTLPGLSRHGFVERRHVLDNRGTLNGGKRVISETTSL